MAPDEQYQYNLFASVGSARNLIPSAFSLAANSTAQVKERWTAFDSVYDFVAEEMVKKGTPIQPSAFSHPDLTPTQVRAFEERSLRHQVAMVLLSLAYGNPSENLNIIMVEAENLVPTDPDPDSGKLVMSGKDQVLLNEFTRLTKEELPDDWAAFFKKETVPLERRREAFARLYAVVGGAWRENSDFARSITPAQRQGMVILAYMCHVSQDQWTTEDLLRLKEELALPEPDWDALTPPSDA